MTYTHTLSQRCELCQKEIGKSNNKKRKYPIIICSGCLASLPPEEHRCIAEVGSGAPSSPIRRCRRWAKWEEPMCPMHTNKKVKVYQEKEEVK